jgi:hypothetical protein
MITEVKIYIIILNLLVLSSCGFQHIARSVSLTDDVDAMQSLYHEDISDEASGETPPLIDSSWNQHWISILATLKADKSEVNEELANYIKSERQRRGLPDLVFHSGHSTS